MAKVGKLKNHALMYKKNVERMKYKLSNYNEIDEIIASFKKNKINLIKYGNNFTSIHTSGNISQGCLKLSPDGKQFQVYLKKFRNQ